MARAKRRIRASGHVEGQNFPCLDQLVQGWKVPPHPGLIGRRPPVGVLVLLAAVFPRLTGFLCRAVLVLHRWGLRTENGGDIRHVEQGQETGDSLDTRGPQFRVQLHPVLLVPGVDAF